MKLFNLSLFPVHIVFLSLLFLSACTIMPTTVGFNDDDSEYFSVTKSGSKLNSELNTELSATVLMTDSIRKKPKEMADEKKDAEFEEEPVIIFRNTYSSAKGYWQAAINYLQIGDVEGARWALEKALILKPRSRVANALMRQLDVDVESELGSTYFYYKVQYGDTLSKLSNVFLDDSLKFFLLARYNNIDNPSRLAMGQIIRIPGNKSPFEIAPVADFEVVEKKDTPVEFEEKSPILILLEDVREMLAAGENQSTIEMIENNVLDVESNDAIKKILVAAYYREAKILFSEKEFTESKVLLNRAVKLDPENVRLNMMLIDMNEVEHVDTIYKNSLAALAKNDYVTAYDLIKKALVAQPNSRKTREKKKEIEKLLSVYYYKQALMAQRKHELDLAIEYWDEVLMLDENNDNAKLYRAKAVNLKIRLEKFASSK